MGFRFRRRIGFGGFHLNLSKSGISASVGIPGATFNLPLASTVKRNPAVTLGLPGTGLSYRKELKQPSVAWRTTDASAANPAESHTAEITRTIHNATPERTEAAIQAVKQAAAMVGTTPTISAPHEVDVSNQTMLSIRCRHRHQGFESWTEYQVVNNMTREVVSRHSTLEEAQRYIATHVHVRQIDVTLGLPAPTVKVAETVQEKQQAEGGNAAYWFVVFSITGMAIFGALMTASMLLH